MYFLIHFHEFYIVYKLSVQNKNLEVRKKKSIIKLKKNNVFLNGFSPSPNESIAINSLSLFNLTKHKSSPKININGAMTLIMFGIK